MNSIPGMPGDVYFGSTSSPLPDWRALADDDDDDPIPQPGVNEILGLDLPDLFATLESNPTRH